MKRINFLFLTIFLTAIISNLSAFIFEPLTMDYSTNGVMSGHYFHSTNITNEEIRLQVIIYEINASADGTEELITAPKDFFIYPNDFTLQPKEENNVRIQYTGSKDIRREVHYRLIVNQIPLDYQEGEGDPDVSVSYTGKIKVVP